jgi:hypothetical protein
MEIDITPIIILLMFLVFYIGSRFEKFCTDKNIYNVVGKENMPINGIINCYVTCNLENGKIKELSFSKTKKN